MKQTLQQSSLGAFFLCLLVLSPSVLSVIGQTSQNSFRVGFVKNTDGEGDWIWLASIREQDRIVSKTIAILGYQKVGVININGRDIELTHVNGNLPDKNFKVGRGGYDTWKGKNIIVRIDYVFTWLCPPKNENCEVYHFKGKLDVRYKGQRRRINIKGSGGS